MLASRTRGEPFEHETYSVSELTEEIRDVLGETFPGIWVVGEVQRARPSQRGHLYFEMVEKGRGDRIVGKLDAVMWRTDHLRVQRNLAASGQRLADGQQIRCWGQVDFYGPGGRLQLIVRDIDPLFTLGLLEKRRRETLDALDAAGLLDLNRQRPLAKVPLDIGLVTSRDSAAFHDFLAGLAESGLGFRVVFVHAAMQGQDAEREVAAALALLADFRSDRGSLKAVALIRGGGSRTDLAAFDSRKIAEAVARCRLPVLTGLGHEIDQSIADRVSHTALKTPTQAAEFLIERVAVAERAVSACEQALVARALDSLRQARDELRSSDRLAQVARLRLQAATHDVRAAARAVGRSSQRRLREARRASDDLARRLGAGAPRHLERQSQQPLRAARRLTDVATGHLRQARAVLSGVARVCSELAPERLLERGYSITRDSNDKIVRDPRQVHPGDTVWSTLAKGSLKSRVEDS